VNAAPAPSISAVLPAYNEEESITAVVRDTADVLNGCAERWEIVVVDDGSSDATAERARAAAPDAPVRVLAHARNRGYGAALRTGFESAAMEAVWVMDSDGQFDPADLRLLLPHYAPDRVVAGYRAHRRDGTLRSASNRAFFSLVRASFGHIAADVNCAFKLFPAEVGRGLRSEGAMISTELLLRARRSGYRVVEVAVGHRPRRAGRATGAAPRVVARAFAELWVLRRDRASLDGLPLLRRA
jgi:glycosyltransferase involved in cell wall biosynthesis